MRLNGHSRLFSAEELQTCSWCLFVSRHRHRTRLSAFLSEIGWLWEIQWRVVFRLTDEHRPDHSGEALPAWLCETWRSERVARTAESNKVWFCLIMGCREPVIGYVCLPSGRQSEEPKSFVIGFLFETSKKVYFLFQTPVDSRADRPRIGFHTSGVKPARFLITWEQSRVIVRLYGGQMIFDNLVDNLLLNSFWIKAKHKIMWTKLGGIYSSHLARSN